jgi:hypothetical protein
MGRESIKTIVAVILIAGVGLYLVSFLDQTPPLPQPKAHEAIGQILGEQAAKRALPGSRIIVISRDTAVFPNPATQFQLRSFHEALKKANRSVAATNAMKLDPLRPVRVPPGDFFEVLRKQQDGDVVVSFLGPPTLSAAQKAQLGDKTVSVLAFCPGEAWTQAEIKSLFELGLLHVAIISRLDPPLVPPQSNDRQDWFRHYYRLLTVADMLEAPASAGGLAP